jgi:hypothetical protein
MSIDSDPVWVRVENVLMTGMRIRTRNYVHSKLPAARDDISESVRRSKPSASIMKGDLRRIECDNTSSAQTSRIGVDAFEIVEPERKVVASGIVFHKRQLGPAHRSAMPPCQIVAGGIYTC